MGVKGKQGQNVKKFIEVKYPFDRDAHDRTVAQMVWDNFSDTKEVVSERKQEGALP